MTQDKWKVEQDKYPTPHFLIQHLQEGVLLKRKTSQMKLKCPEIRPYLKCLKQLQLHDGHLYRKVFSDKTGKQAHLLQLVLPSKFINQAIRGCHEEVGHLGRDKTLELLRERFHRPSMYRDVVFHLSNCSNCLKRKGVAPKAELCLTTANRSLELVHMDFLSLELSKGYIENVLVITDHFTRYVQAIPSRTQTAQATAKILWENFIQHYGFPEKFISDQGRNFETELIKDIRRIANIDTIRQLLPSHDKWSV